MRAILGQPAALRVEAEDLLESCPGDCADVLAWSPEGYAVALVASVLAEARGRDLVAHRASLVTPLARPLRTERWTWASAEELLGLGPVRSWASAWAATQGGAPHGESVVSLSVLK